jgi:hypothetical protein
MHTGVTEVVAEFGKHTHLASLGSTGMAQVSTFHVDDRVVRCRRGHEGE